MGEVGRLASETGSTAAVAIEPRFGGESEKWRGESAKFGQKRGPHRGGRGETASAGARRYLRGLDDGQPAPSGVEHEGAENLQRQQQTGFGDAGARPTPHFRRLRFDFLAPSPPFCARPSNPSATVRTRSEFTTGSGGCRRWRQQRPPPPHALVCTSFHSLPPHSAAPRTLSLGRCLSLSVWRCGWARGLRVGGCALLRAGLSIA